MSSKPIGKEAMSIVVRVRLPPTVYQTLLDYANDNAIGVATIVRLALTKYFRDSNTPT